MTLPDDRSSGVRPDSERGTAVVPSRAPGDTEPTQPGAEVLALDAPEPVPVVPGFELIEEVGRGGMGVVYRAADTALRRDVAVKILLHQFAPAGASARRFVEEARITSQLQHPGIPPVHQVGALAGGRPFLVMKLIRGQTLDDLLLSRTQLGEDRARLVAVFEAVCQAVGFAHAHGIIHRDLKPANIMVGAFGEVQVMDWGLAKPVVRGQETGNRGQNTEVGEDTEPPPANQSRAAPTDATREGSILGTPAFMAPEQAQGAMDEIDQRSDVFGLGAVLCAILTGQPPYVGASPDELRRMAVGARLSGAWTRLGACGADPELEELCKRCLAIDPADRPADANAVAAAVAAFRGAAEDRARQAELDRVRAETERAEAEARAGEQRKRRRAQLALAAAVVLLVSGAGTFAWWREAQAAERKATEARLAGQRDEEARNKSDQADRGVTTNLALAADLRKQYRFKAAGAALAQAAELVAGGAPERRAEVDRARADLAFVVQLDDIRYRKWVWVGNPGGTGDFDTQIGPAEYRKAFAARGLDLTTMSPADAVRVIAASGAKTELVAALDDWALYEDDGRVRDRLLEVARRADPGPWTDRLRDPAVWANRAALEKLEAEVDPKAVPAPALRILARLMGKSGRNPAEFLARARAAHPADFDLAFAHGLSLGTFSEGRAVGPYEAARTLRPDNAVAWANLANALLAANDRPGALAANRRAAELAPDFAPMHINLGLSLSNTDRPAAVAACRRAVELDPGLAPARLALGVVLKADGDPKAALVEFRRATELAPDSALAHFTLGTALNEAGDPDGALRSLERAAALNPRDHKPHYHRGLILNAKGDRVGALAAFERAVAIHPGHVVSHFHMGLVLKTQRKLPAAASAFERVVALDPKNAAGYVNLGAVARELKDPIGTVLASKRAVELDPDHAGAHFNLGSALMALGDAKGSVAALKRSVELDSGYAPAHINLGGALAATGQLPESIAAYERAIELAPRSALAHSGMAATYLEMKRYPEAISSAQAALKINAKSANAHGVLGLALARTGDIPSAHAAVTKAAQLDKSWASVLAQLPPLPPLPVAPPPRAVNR